MLQNFNKMQRFLALSFTALCLLSMCCVFSRQLSMKVVKEPTNYGMGLINQEPAANQSPLKTRVPPANFSGPLHLLQLKGRCLSKFSNDYKYQLCLFDNVTQHEQTLRWNPFNGVLGVWQQWVIENNTFVAMMMQEGDPCGDRFRSAKVELACGNKTEIDSISEPETCQYLMRLKTPLCCDPRSLLVYPTLPRDLQEEWDLLEGSLLYGDITLQGYKKQLQSVFLRAGFFMSSEQRQVQKSLKNDLEKRRKLSEGNFDSLMECQAEYRRLYANFTSLQMQSSTEISNVTAAVL